MKKHILLIFSLLFSITAFAQKQDRAKMMEDIQKFKIDFLAKEMSLSEKEKAEFAPIYKEYDEEIRKSGADAFKFERELKKKKDAATEADYKKLADLQKKSRENFDAISKKYDERFEKFLSAKQIYQMHKGEEKFFEKMKEMRKKHKDQKNKGGKGNPDKKAPSCQI